MMHTWFEGKIRYEKVAENGFNYFLYFCEGQRYYG